MSVTRRVLVIGSGGREHALALRLLASDSVAEVIVSPGNAGTESAPAELAHKTLRNRAGDPVAIAREERIDLVVVGPEVPLCAGLADELRAQSVLCFGPSKAAARLEGSKSFMKDFCRRHGIRAARDAIVTRLEDLDAALSLFDEAAPPVVKADGLAAGKGVVVAETMEEARSAARLMLTGESFGEAGSTVVLEERLIGSEVSIHGICDGERCVLLPTAQDHKRIFEGDRGPNTGGMGTYAPAPVVSTAALETIERDMMSAVVSGMKKDGTPFVGTLFAGLMITESGPVVLEYNVRFGDPETESLMQLIEGDLGEMLFLAAEGRLPDTSAFSCGTNHALSVVLAAHGYPESPRKGDVISGLEEASAVEGVRVYHAGTSRKGNSVVTSGGRVLVVSASGETLKQAQERAYRASDRIHFEGKQWRRDIGFRALGESI